MINIKLIRSKTEQDFRQQLINSHKSLFEDKGNEGLLKVIRDHNPNIRTAYVVNWIPEQGEDIYKILVDDDLILEIEIDRVGHNKSPLVSPLSLTQYRAGLSKLNQIKLAVALDLAKQDLEK